MIRISDSALGQYFSSLQEGTELSRSEVERHLSLYSFDFTGVTGEEDLQRFRVTSPGQMTERAGLIQSRAKLSPIFADPGLSGREQLAESFSQSISSQVYQRTKSAIEMQIIRQNGLDFTGKTQSIYQMNFGTTSHVGEVPDRNNTPFYLKMGSENIRLTLPTATEQALVGTDLYNEIYSEVLLGPKKGLVYDKKSRSFVQSNQLATVIETKEKTGTYIPRKDDVTNNEVDYDRKLSNMWKQSVSTYLGDSKSVDEVMNTLDFGDASRIESMSEDQILNEYDDIRTVVTEMSKPSKIDEQNIDSEVDKLLGVEAKQADKDRLKEELMEKKKNELMVENTKAFKETAKMYIADRRDYLDPGSRNVNLEDQWDDVYKEAYYIKKAEDEKEKYLNRVRKATHTQQEDGSWVKNDRLPNRNADRTRQAISVDMNPETVSDNLTESLVSTIKLGQKNLADAQNSIEAETAKLKEQRNAYNQLFEKHTNRQSSMAEIDAMIAEKVTNYKLWSGSVGNSMQWMDRKELDYIMEHNGSDEQYYDTYLSSKKRSAFEFDSKASLKEYEERYAEYRRGIEAEVAQRYSDMDVTGEYKAQAIRKEVEDIINHRRREAQEATRKSVIELLATSKTGMESTDDKRIRSMIARQREEEIALTIRNNFELLEEGTEKPTGQQSQYLWDKRLGKAEELFARDNNVSVDDLFMTQEDTINVSNYIRLSTEIKGLEERRAGLDPLSIDYAKATASINNAKGSLNAVLYDLELQNGVEEKAKLAVLQSDIQEQSEKVSRLKRVIQNDGYEDSYADTLFDKETGQLVHVGISKDMYDTYRMDPEKLDADVRNMSAENAYNRERAKAANRESWYRALGNGQIVKGHYNDERGYHVTEIDSDSSIAYLKRPTVKVSNLQYTTDIDNKELLANIDSVNETLGERFNPSNKQVVDYNVMLANFEDTNVGHVTLFSELPAIEYIEPEFSDEDVARSRQQITTYLSKNGNVPHSRLPKWAQYQLDQYMQESETQRQGVLHDINVARESLEAAKEKGISPEELIEEQNRLKAEQDRLNIIAKESTAMRNALTERILADIEQTRVNDIVKRNDRVKREIELFGFEQGTDNARVEFSRDKLTQILIGDEKGTTAFYENLIDSHFPHLRNAKGNGTASVADATLNVIDDHVSQQTEFDLRDEALTRRYMQSLDPNALNPSDLSESNNRKLKAYVDTLSGKGMYDRLRDTLFSDIVQKTIEAEYGGQDGEFDNTIKNIYNAMSEHYPDADITGQSMYSYIHNPENTINQDLKRTYQSKALKLSPDAIDAMLSQYRTMGYVSLEALAERGQEATEALENAINENVKKTLSKLQADELLASHEENFLSDNMQRPTFRIDETRYNKAAAMTHFLDTDIDTSDLKKTDLNKGWDKLIENFPHMAKVQELIKRSSMNVRRQRDPEGIHAQRISRLSLYALGALNNQEAKYQSVLKLEDTIDIFDDRNLMNLALENPNTLNERQVATALELADKLGKKVEVQIPIGDGQFTNGYLRFNDASEIEAYSPSLKQSYLVNDSGTSSVSTVRIDDMRAYGSDNRMKAARSYSKQQPILRQSIANEAQMKRSGNSMLISNVDSSFGELVDFVENNKIGISYDIETTMTNPNKLKNVVQPIEIYAQQIQMNPETGDLYRDAQGNFAVREEILESMTDENGNQRIVKGSDIVAKDYHAIMALEQPAIDLINKIAADDNYFNISQDSNQRVHIVDFINANNLKGSESNVDFVQGLFGRKMKKSKANALMNELTTKAEEYQFLNNVAKYRFGANKGEQEIERFGVYSNAKAVDNRKDFAEYLKQNDRTKYKEFFDADGNFNEANTNYFNRIAYGHQLEQTKALTADALRAAENLSNKDFDFGNGVRPVSVAEGISGFVDFQRDSGSDVFFVQNGEIADNKTLVDSARLIDRRSSIDGEVFSDGLKTEIDKIITARNALLQGEIGKFTEEYADKFGINPRTAAEQRQKAAEILSDPNRDKAGYLKSKNKVWVESLTEALEYLPEMNRSNSNVRFTSQSLKDTDRQLAIYTSMIDKLTSRSGEYTPEEMEIAKQLDLFGGNEFSIQNNTVTTPKLEKKVQAMYDSAGVSDQQNISRVVNPELRSQSNAALMAAHKFNAELAHDGKVDTIFGSENVERFTRDVFNHINNVEGANSPLSYILRSMDAGSAEDGNFMERNAYRGDGTEHITLTERPSEGIQKGVYRLLGFNEEGTAATLQRVVQGQDGVILDTSLEPVELRGQTNAELAHIFAKSVRHVPEENVETEIHKYTRDITRRHFDKILSNNLSYDSHMNQIREMEIQSGEFGPQSSNPLFSIRDEGDRVNLLNASMEELIDATDRDGAIHLDSNPLERARQAFADSVIPKEQLRELIGSDSVRAFVSDMDRSLIRNSHLLEDSSKEKFYNKEMTKEQVMAMQDINDFNHTDLGMKLADLMDNVTALESQGLVNQAEKADILSQWNEALKEKATQSKRVYEVKDTAVIPEFLLNVKNESGEIRGVPIQSNLQISSPTEVADSLQSIARRIGGLRDYSSAKDMVGLREDYALNAEIVPHLKGLGVLSASDIELEDGKNRFMGLGELSHMIYNNLQENPGLLKRATAVNYLSFANNISDADLDSLDNKASELLSPYLARQTDVQALQFEGLKESKRSLIHDGMYIPGMKLETGSYSPEDVADLKRYSSSSFLGQQSTSDLVGMADNMAGSGSSADKERTKLIYREIMNRAATAEDGTKNIDPQAIIDSGNRGRIEAAAAMNWIKPITTSASTNTYVANDNMAERRIGYGQYAGSQLGDIPEYALDNQAYMAYQNMMTPSYNRDYNRMAHLQQQEMIANWREQGYEGHDHQVDNKFNTARGEAPLSPEDLAAHNELIKARYGDSRRNETPAPMTVDAEDSIEGMVSRARDERPTQYFANNENIAGRLNIHPPVSAEEVQARSARALEIEKPTRERAPSDLEDFLSRKRADIGDAVDSLLEGGNGSKWVAGLGVAAAALFAVNAMNSPMKLETRPAGHGVQGVTGTPEDDTDRRNRQAESRESLNIPTHQNGGTSYVTAGEKGYTIKASGQAPSNIDSSQLQSTINNSMGGASGVNINLRDDRSTLDGTWLESQFSNFIERGSVGG